MKIIALTLLLVTPLLVHSEAVCYRWEKNLFSASLVPKDGLYRRHVLVEFEPYEHLNASTEFYDLPEHWGEVKIEVQNSGINIEANEGIYSIDCSNSGKLFANLYENSGESEKVIEAIWKMYGR